MASANVWSNDRSKAEGRNNLPEQPASVVALKAQDTKEVLRKGFASMSSEDIKALRYKAPSGPANTKTGGPWASKPNTMGSGKDFFLELRKQISALQQSERAGG